MCVRWGELFEPAEGRGRIRSMEGIRGLAVLMVFAAHYVSTVEPWLKPLAGWARFFDTVHHVGNAGVDLFFVLSGYLIFGASLGMTHVTRFMRRRIVRIYPVFAFMMLIYLLLSYCFPERSKIPADQEQALLFLVQNFLLMPGIFDVTPIITVAWSLSYEVVFYLTLPPLVRLLERGRLTPAARSIGWFLLAALIAQVMDGAYVRAIMFLSGILVFEAQRELRWRCPPGLGVAGLFGALLYAAAANDVPTALHSQPYVLFAGYGLFCFECFSREATAGRARVVAAMAWRPLRWLGNMSYSFYLVHGLALNALGLVLEAVPPGTPGLVVALGMVLPALLLAGLASTAVYLLIERPFSLSRSPRLVLG